MSSSRMLRRVALGRTDVSEELSAYIIMVTRIDDLGTTLAVTSNRRTLRRATRRNITKDGILRYWMYLPAILLGYISHYLALPPLHSSKFTMALLGLRLELLELLVTNGVSLPLPLTLSKPRIILVSLSTHLSGTIFYLGSYGITAKGTSLLSVACALPRVCASTSRLPRKQKHAFRNTSQYSLQETYEKFLTHS
jgi:hypothetical protein